MSGHLPLFVRWLSRTGVLPRAAVAQLDAKRSPSAQSVIDAGRMAEMTYQLLDQLDQDVVLLARRGQDLTQFGLKHSHIGFAVRNLRRQEWGVVHLLNADDAGHSAIYNEGMVNFYSDRPFRFESEVLTVPIRYRGALRELLLQPPKSLHCPEYSLTSHPNSLITQNSNQWVLELLASVVADIAEPTRAKCQAWLREKGYEPSHLPIALPTQWAGPLLRDSIRFWDQPSESRRNGVVSTVTVDSVYDWLASPLGPFADDLGGVSRHSLAA